MRISTTAINNFNQAKGEDHMNQEQMARRYFLRTTALGTAAVALGAGPIGSAAESGRLQIKAPFHGAVLNRRLGKEVAGGLEIQVSGDAPAGARVTVNNIPAKRAGTGFDTRIVLKDKETDIVAVAETAGGHSEDRIRVVWDKNSFPRYRFSVDDNSFFLRDIARKKYRSLFDCFYLDVFRKLNKKYGAKFVLNIYYTTEDGFTLPQFPDRYKGEWKDNSDWLKLAFHAHANMPNRPYEDTPPEKLIADLDKVNEQILRFAGPETLTPPTVIHWGMTRTTVFKPLYQRGVRVLSGLFRLRGEKYDINYRLDNTRSEYLSKHDALKDFESGIVFSLIDIVCNNTPIDRIVPTLEPLTKNPNTAEIMDLFTHEQYFWPFYRRYIPDHAQRLDAAIRWCTEHGYKPVLFHEGLLGAPA